MTSAHCGDRWVDRSIAGGIDRLAMIARRLSLACIAVAAVATPVAAQSPPYVARGIRWIGAATECVAPAGWRAERVFTSAPHGVANLCLYLWLAPDQPPT